MNMQCIEEVSFGTRLKSALSNKKKSQSWLAKEMGVSSAAVNKWTKTQEIGGISAENLSKLTRVLEFDFVSGETITNHNIYDECLKFKTRLLAAKNDSALFAQHVSEFIRLLGYSHYVFMQHYKGHFMEAPPVLVMTDVDEDWRKHYRETGYAENDPTWKYCQEHVEPILSQDLIAYADSVGCSFMPQMFSDFRKYGYLDHIVVPIHGPSWQGSMVLIVDDLDNRPALTKMLPFVMTVMFYIHSAANEMFEEANGQLLRPYLDEKEKELVAAFLSGKPDHKIAEDMHIAVDTVRYRLSKIQKKLRVVNRQQLALSIAAQGITTTEDQTFKAYSSPFPISGDISIKSFDEIA